MKYQIFIEGTSLFAEVENSEKTTETIKQEIIKKKGNKKNEEESLTVKLDKKIKEYETKINDMELRIDEINNLAKEKLKNGDNVGAENLIIKRLKITENIKMMEGNISMLEEQKFMLDNACQMKDVMSAIKQGNSAVKEKSKGMSVEDMMDDMEEINPNQEEINDFFKEYADEDVNKEYVSDIINDLKDEINGIKKENMETKINEYNNEDDLEQFLSVGDIGIKKEKKDEKKEKKEIKKEEKKEIKKEEKKEKEENIKLNLNNKDDIMKIINSQNFIEGFWDINNKTKIIKKKYENEFKLLKGLKGQKIDDIIAMTIIIIYFINKEHKELLGELVMILKKAKLYIQDKIEDSYENIIKKAGIK